MFQAERGIDVTGSRFVSLVFVGASIALFAGCSRSPEQRLASGNDYFSRKAYREAIIEYRSALLAKPKLAEARLRLAEAYVAMDEAQNAYQEYVRAADLLPDNDDVQIKAGNFLLVANRFEDAKARALTVLDRNAGNVDAQVLLGYALAGLQDLDGAVAHVEKALIDAPNRTGALTNLATLQMAQGDKERAEATFRRAVQLNPKAAIGWIALADFHWSQGHVQETEASLVKARELEPGNLVAARALALVYLSTDRASSAEPIVKTLAVSSTKPSARLLLADFYVASRRPAEALAVLEPLVSQDASRADALTRMAVILDGLGWRNDAYTKLEALLSKEPNSFAAYQIKARLLLEDRRFDEALAAANQAITLNSQSARGHGVLGEIHAARNELAAAVKSLTEALRLDPTMTDVRLEMVRVQLAQGRPDAAADYAQDAVRMQPNRIDAGVLLATALTARGDSRSAESELKQLLRRAPESPQVHAAMGRLSLLKQDRRQARQFFQRALALAPESDEALAGAVAVDVADGQVAEAQKRLAARLQIAPRHVETLLLAGRTAAETGDLERAQQMLRQVIEIDPGQLRAYDLLGQIYISQRRLAEAQSEFERIAARQPKATGPQTMIATLLQLQDRIPEARQRFEAIVQNDPQAVVASNNLAWIYATSGGNLDVALNLAEAAKKQLPDQPEVNDTLGWIYYKKNLPKLAIDALEQSVRKDTANPLYQFHLGLAYARHGEPAKSRAALERALAIDSRFPGADEARQTLASFGAPATARTIAAR